MEEPGGASMSHEELVGAARKAGAPMNPIAHGWNLWKQWGNSGTKEPGENPGTQEPKCLAFQTSFVFKSI